MKQSVRFLTTPDHITLAWAETGGGPALVKASNWLTHLEYDWESPVWRHWTEFFAGHFRYVRYDERGCGMTDRDVGDLSLWRWTDDLEAVVAAAKVDDKFILIGCSQGAAIALDYVVRHPERVSRLVLYGGYAAGAKRRDEETWAHFYEGMERLSRFGWDKANPTFRQVFTSRFIPEGSEEQIEWFNELCRKTTTPDIAAKLISVRAEVDVHHLLTQVQTPTLVLHAVDDEVVPFSEGKKLAAGIPNAEMIQLDSRNHILLEHEPAWQQFCGAVLDFTGQSTQKADMLDSLSGREREIFESLAQGRTNAEIGWELNISEKTVRNHITHIYAKLGVRNRARAIALANELKRSG